jgi:hypothetical protein
MNFCEAFDVNRCLKSAREALASPASGHHL